MRLLRKVSPQQHPHQLVPALKRLAWTCATSHRPQALCGGAWRADLRSGPAWDLAAHGRAVRRTAPLLSRHNTGYGGSLYCMADSPSPPRMISTGARGYTALVRRPW